ncbi:probable G-protein coupled receptor B0563.6 [Saccostrea echinata]|uniref:probable G-protein coupled receptor B0563.6 n=1 Tax=Saccostrea echinata TaxID=191078 RepID=UPI002A80497C|nr:probable G-protein coupled receptor B0563.6 [Saccostrea echinata]
MHDSSGLHIAFGILSADDSLCETVQNKSDLHVITNETLDIVWRIFVFGLIPIFSVFGFVGNILSLAVLYHNRMRNPTNFCLSALALADLGFLAQSLLFVGTNIQRELDSALGEQRSQMLYPWFGAYASLVAARISSCLILLLTIERFIAVCFPIRAKLICNTRCTLACLIAICLVTSIVFLPYAFKYKIVYDQKNATQTTLTGMHLTLSKLGKNKAFFEVYGIILNIVYRFIPIILVLVLNCRIIIITRKTCSTRKLMGTLDAKIYSNEQTRITLMLVTISLLFVLCTLPGAMQSILSHYADGYTMTGQYRYAFQCFSYVAYFLETLNCSLNFFIYMVMSKKFHRTYKEIFCCLKKQMHYQVPCNSKESLRGIQRSETRLLHSSMKG